MAKIKSNRTPLPWHRRTLALLVCSLLVFSACSAGGSQSANSSDTSVVPPDISINETTNKILSSEADCPKADTETPTAEEGSSDWPQRQGIEADASDPEPIESTGSNKLDVLTTDDPTTFECLVYLGQGEEEILNADKGAYELVSDAHLFRAEFSDGTSIAMRAHPELGDVNAATAEVDRYTKALGQLPHVLRADVCRFAVRSGDETATASFREGMSVQAGNMDVRIGDNRMEETLFHEAIHTSLDHKHSYGRSQGWLDAQEADGKWLTSYGRENPDSEDFAETALYAWALMNHPDRVPDDQAAAWSERVPNRIAYLEELFRNAPTDRGSNSEPTSCEQQ